ncbi:MAG: radical SAM protein [bacterium]|nr:radical SAM protein [bacterium]
MVTAMLDHIYGPVPSRRLGRSLGIDLVPFKTCTYDCVYCQLGRTTNKTIERKEYFPIDELLAELKMKAAAGPPSDYISLSGSGEPTLHSRIGDLIDGIKGTTDIPVAVLTNGSLLWRREVQDALMDADLVLPSLDAGDVHVFRHVNRPHPEIEFQAMVEGIAEFTGRFAGSVWLEVLLLAGVTGIAAEVEKIAALAGRIRPERIQLNTVLRPPCEDFTYPVPAERLRAFARLFHPAAEVIDEGGMSAPPPSPQAGIGNVDILILLRRRPCTVRDVSAGLGMHVNEATKRLEALRKRGLVSTVRRDGAVYYTAAAG